MIPSVIKSTLREPVWPITDARRDDHSDGERLCQRRIGQREEVGVQIMIKRLLTMLADAEARRAADRNRVGGNAPPEETATPPEETATPPEETTVPPEETAPLIFPAAPTGPGGKRLESVASELKKALIEHVKSCEQKEIGSDHATVISNLETASTCLQQLKDHYLDLVPNGCGAIKERETYCFNCLFILCAMQYLDCNGFIQSYSEFESTKELLPYVGHKGLVEALDLLCFREMVPPTTPPTTPPSTIDTPGFEIMKYVQVLQNDLYRWFEDLHDLIDKRPCYAVTPIDKEGMKHYLQGKCVFDSAAEAMAKKEKCRFLRV
ncbi:MAG: hypothetical protein HQL50_09920 [Magnetococcales bacterium]|nr:hypothetical protein [Magnetococcales bacterium]